MKIKLSLLFAIAVMSAEVIAQVPAATINSGSWFNPANWNCACIPTSGNAAITIGHSMTIPSNAGFPSGITIDQATITTSGKVTVVSGGRLVVANSAQALLVQGELETQQGGVLVVSGTSSLNVQFANQATYTHNYTTSEGTIPRATWDPGSTLNIIGYTSPTVPSGNVLAPWRASGAGNWSQTFGNVNWNCIGQTANFSLEGRLTTITGKFNILSTGNATPRTLYFTLNDRYTMNIAGEFEVEGSSSFVGTSTILDCIINIGTDFNFHPSVASSSFLTVRGGNTFNIGGDFIMNAPGSTLYLANNTTSNTSSGVLNITDDFALMAGTLTEGVDDAFTSSGSINFRNDGGGATHDFINNGTISNRIIYRVAATNDTLNLISPTDKITGHTGSSFSLNGVLVVRSTAPHGAIQAGSLLDAPLDGDGGQVRTATKTFAVGSAVIYGGTQTQFVGSGHASTASIIVDNPAGVELNARNATTGTLLSTVTFPNLTIENGNFTASNNNLTINDPSSIVTLNGGNLIINSGVASRTITFRDVISNEGEIIVSCTAFPMTFTINGALTLNDGDFTISNLAQVATLTALGDINLITGGMVFNSGTANLTTTFGGDLTGAGLLTFTGTQNNFTFSGAGTYPVPFPFNGQTTLRNFTLSRPSAVLQIDVPLTVTTNLLLTAGNIAITNSAIIAGDLNIDENNNLSFENGSLELQNQFNETHFGGLLRANENSILNLTGSGVVDTLFFETGFNTVSKLILNRPTAGILVRLTTPLTVVDSLVLLDGVMNAAGLSFVPGMVLLRHSNASLTIVGAFPAASYDLVYDGSALTSGAESTGSVSNFTVSTTGNVTLANGMTIANETEITSGGLNINSRTVSTGSITNSSTLSASTGRIILSGNWTNTGTFNMGTSTIEIAVGATATLSSASALILYNLENNGTLIPPNILEIRRNFVNNGLFSGGTGTVRFSGSVAQNITGGSAGSNTLDFYNVEVTNKAVSPDLVFARSADVRGRFQVASAAVVNLGTSVLRLVSSNDTPTADGTIGSLLNNARIDGNVRVQRYMRAEKGVNRYISFPITTARKDSLADDFTITDESIRWYDETRIDRAQVSRWPRVQTFSETLVRGRGYAAWMFNNVVIRWDLTGPIHYGPISFPITRSMSTIPEHQVADGWNLIGNPYPSSIRWSHLAGSGWTGNNISTTIYVPDENPGGFRIYNSADPSGATLPDGIIATGQAFYVYAGTGSTPTLTIDENAKVVSGSGNFYRTGKTDTTPMIVMTLEKDSLKDWAYLKINKLASRDFEMNFDAFKLYNDYLNISIQDDSGRPMGVHSIDDLPEGKLLPVQIAVSVPGKYTIGFESVQLPDADMYLIDTWENKSLAVNTAARYVVDIGSELKMTNRFYLVRGEPNSLEKTSSVNVFPNPVREKLYVIFNSDRATKITVHDMSGRVLISEIWEENGTIDFSELESGVYFLQIDDGLLVTTKKIFKQ